MAATKGTATETKAENWEATFQSEESLMEIGASGLGGGEDEAGEGVGFTRQVFAYHLASTSIIPPTRRGVTDRSSLNLIGRVGLIEPLCLG